MELSLNDFHARLQDPQLLRFWQTDPHAVKYLAWSPYNHVYNNPLKFIDPDGKDVGLGNLYNKDKSGNLLYPRQVLAFELFALTKTGKEFILNHAQKGFSLKGEMIKGLKINVENAGKLSKNIDASFRVTDLDVYEKIPKALRIIGADGYTEAEIKEGKLSVTYHLNIDKDDVKVTKDWKKASPNIHFIILKSLDTWLHEVFIHGDRMEREFIKGTYNNGIVKKITNEDDDHKMRNLNTLKYSKIIDSTLFGIRNAFSLQVSDKDINKHIIFTGYSD